MTTNLLIDRELLERVAQYTPNIDRQEDRARAISELRSVLDSAPRQPEGDNSGKPNLQQGEGLEVVAFIPIDRSTGEQWRPVKVKGSGAICDYIPLCRLSDAQRAIAELNDELDAAREILAQQGRNNTELRAERDAQRAIAELRDRLAGLLQKARWYVASARYSDNDEGDFAARRQAVMLTDIDAALAEVNK